MVSDERMRDLVMQSLRLHCGENSMLRALLALHRRKLDASPSAAGRPDVLDDEYVVSRLAAFRRREAQRAGEAAPHAEDAAAQAVQARRLRLKAASAVDGYRDEPTRGRAGRALESA